MRATVQADSWVGKEGRVRLLPLTSESEKQLWLVSAFFLALELVINLYISI